MLVHLHNVSLHVVEPLSSSVSAPGESALVKRGISGFHLLSLRRWRYHFDTGKNVGVDVLDAGRSCGDRNPFFAFAGERDIIVGHGVRVPSVCAHRARVRSGLNASTIFTTVLRVVLKDLFTTRCLLLAYRIRDTTVSKRAVTMGRQTTRRFYYTLFLLLTYRIRDTAGSKRAVNVQQQKPQKGKVEGNTGSRG